MIPFSAVQSVVVLVFGFVVLIMFAVLVFSLFETREIWNGGVCAGSGKPWTVLEINGALFLDDNAGHRVRLGAVVIHPAITDALRRQKGGARA